VETHNDIIERGALLARPLALLTLIWALQVASPCGATVTADASATARYEYDSNVFDLQNGYPVPGTTDYQRSDSLYTYGAAFDASYLWSQQKLFALLSTTEYKYDHFSQLSHDEYNLDGGWDWKLGPTLDGVVEAMRTKSMVPFTNVNFSQFVLQTEQRESAKLGLAISHDWRLEGSGYYSDINQVFFDGPDLGLRTSYAETALKYVGQAGLTFGLSGGYMDGRYSGPIAADNSTFHQTNTNLVATYQPSGHSSLDAALGYSDRTSASQLSTLSGFTGEINYANQLTGLTSLQIQLSRLINSFVPNVSAEIDSIALINVRWQATYKIGVVAGYTFTNRELPGQGNAPVGSTRLDHIQYGTIKADYEPLRWLSIKPYVSIQTRSSNFVSGNFNATVYGVNFTVQWENGQSTPSAPLK
jgi:hypothetical protein